MVKLPKAKKEVTVAAENGHKGQKRKAVVEAQSATPKRKRGGAAKIQVAKALADTEVAAEAEAVEAPAAPPAAKKARARAAPHATIVVRGSRLNFLETAEVGIVLTLGQGDTGQLGLGEGIMERSKPALVKDLQDVVDVCAGGMHSVCLTKNGEVYTFGCNDEGALGRLTEEDEECYTPGKVELPGKIVQVSAGDSHTVAINDQGQAFYWGTFRDNSGAFGLTPAGEVIKTPLPLTPSLRVVKVASGSDHVVLLTDKGEVYTLGCAEQGQLGRVGERFVVRGGRRGLTLLLSAERVHAKSRRVIFTDVWAGSWSTFALTTDNEVLVCGLNNYNQLGLAKGQLYYTLVKSESFTKLAENSGLKRVTPGQHHALALNSNGHAFAVGRNDYGRLGLGKEGNADAIVPTEVPDLSSVIEIACGSVVSFAVVDSGDVFSWGMGTNGQLGHEEEDEDAWQPTRMLGKQLETKKVLKVAAGGQHTILLAKEK